MNFTSVLLFCSGAIALCAAVVFLVETVVAFSLNEQERFVQPTAVLLSLEQEDGEIPLERAA